jgi:clan AA aspartic protease (TIGR02281 family)
MKKSHVILSGCILLSVSVANTHTGQQDFSEIERQINYFERIVNDYFRGDPRRAANEAIGRLIDDYNKRIDASNNELKVRQEELDAEFASLEKLKQHIDELDQELKNKPAASDESALEKYNAKLGRLNFLIEEYNKKGEAFKERQEKYNKAISEFNTETSNRKESIDARKKEYYEFIDAYDAWFKAGKDDEFYLELNRFYSNLIQQSRRSPSKQALNKYIERIKALRNELGEIVAEKELAKENGAIIVKVIFPGNEPCYMILDTGATRVSLPMEIAEVLGLSDKLGDEIETGLADGNKAKGRSVIIPSVTVAGTTVRNVAGIIMPSPAPGTDGLLGMSFLKNFLIEIDTERNPQVILKYKRR